MAEPRDPRIDPRPGDVLVLHHVGMRIEVTSNDGSRVTWVVHRRNGRDYENGWGLENWRKIIAPKARIIRLAEASHG